MYLKNFIISLIFASGFFNLFHAGTTVTDSILSDGVYRKYTLYVPSIYNAAQSVPLILNLHGYGSNGAQQQLYANFMPVADTANFLVVQPDGTSLLGSPFWNAGFVPGSPDDVLFISRLIDSLKLNYNIDLNSVYSCGMSNGGIMSLYLAVNLSNKIAAIANVAGSTLDTWLANSPQRAVPIMMINGTGDATVPYNGNGSLSHIDSVVKKWVKHNGCNNNPITSAVPDINSSDNCSVTHYKYLNGIDNSSVELYKVNNGGHAWPGSLPIFANTNLDFNATNEIWRFFKKYKKNQFVSPVGLTEIKNDVRVSLYPNPSSDYITIKSTNDLDGTIFIYNALGEKVQQQIVHQNSYVSVKDLSVGIYSAYIKTTNSIVKSNFIKN
jgi:polyhydroxybutyrate depolymerase